MYDLSKGVAKMTTGALIGRTLEGIWHTGLVAYGREYFFTKSGVGSVIPVSINYHTNYMSFR